ncbi:MAG: FHA domain-containing protein [Sedimentisphaerales bacterium]|nr:FHA domain-containing protein [Sedimentisphaerales bacterium]
MTENSCPQCGAILTGDRARFCHQCGSDLLEAQGTKREETPSETQNLASLRGREVAVESEQDTTTGASSVGEQERESTRLREKNTSRGLTLSINANQFYMQGFRAVLDIKVDNVSDVPFESIEVEASGDLLGRVERWACSLGACEGLRKRFGLKLEDAGIEMIEFRVVARQGDSVYSYWAETDLPVFEKTDRLSDIKIQADRFINVGGGAGGSKDMAHAVNVNIENLIKQDRIQNANDLMREYRRFPPDFEVLHLVYDPKGSGERAGVSGVTPKGGKKIIDSRRGSPVEIASLRIKTDSRPFHVLLVAKAHVGLGKHRGNDIVTRICPRSPEHDHLSNQMSRDHCRLELTPKGVLVQDRQSVNGTFLDGRQVNEHGCPIEGRDRELDLAGVFKLGIRRLGQRAGTDEAAYRGLLDAGPGQLWDTASQAGIESIVLTRLGNLGPDDENGRECYCLVYRLATIGSDKDCVLCLTESGLEPVHAAVVYLRDRFYLENLSEPSTVTVNDRMLLQHELMPLSFGDRIRIARLEMEFAQRSQLLLGSS